MPFARAHTVSPLQNSFSLLKTDNTTLRSHTRDICMYIKRLEINTFEKVNAIPLFAVNAEKKGGFVCFKKS